ncbi:MAG: hypothetical protein IKJ99_07550 [Oscillospiraceae bacterium]|nr:hypothetical protein [Oscillospiraceae bacterium]
MNAIFLGLTLVLLDLDVTIGTATIELLPDFLGFFLILKGMTALAGENKFFNLGRHLAFGLAIVYFVLFAAAVMNPGTFGKVIFWCVGLAALIGQLALMKKIVAGIRQMELDSGKDLKGERIQAMWLILVVLSTLRHLLSWVPIVGGVCGIAELLVGILFLAAFRECVRRYKVK